MMMSKILTCSYLLCMTIYDIYMKKQVVTGVIDELKRRQDASDERAKAAEKEKREERKRK